MNDTINLSNLPAAGDMVDRTKVRILIYQSGRLMHVPFSVIDPISAADILTELKTVDGAGSGLDADLLDGLNGAYYLDYTNATNKPSTFPPSAHDHDSIVSTPADMSAGFKTAGNRFVVNDGPNLGGTDVMTVSETGAVTTGGNVSSGSSNFIGSPIGTSVVLSPGNAGQVYLRPNGSGSTTGQTTIDSTGTMVVGGTLTAAQQFSSSTTAVCLNTTGAGTVFLRPNGVGSTTGQTTIDSAGVLTTAAGITATTGNITSVVGTVVGAAVLSTGNISSSQNYISTSTAVHLATTGAGTIRLRPNGAGSATGETTIDSSGAMTVNGAVTTTSGIVTAFNRIASQAFSATGASVGWQISSGITSSSFTGTTAADHRQFYNANGKVGSISTSASTTAFTTSSDENLKNFIGIYDPLSAIEIIRADPVRDFTWKIDDTYAVGWGAQTSYNVSQDLATPPPPRPPEEMQEQGPGTDPKEPGYNPWGMDHGKRTPYLWAALTWALDKIDTLEARVAALESIVEGYTP